MEACLACLEVNTYLQKDFLLLEDVSLFVLDVLPLLEWRYSSDKKKMARRVLAVVEAVCEGPVAVLRAQAM